MSYFLKKPAASKVKGKLFNTDYCPQFTSNALAFTLSTYGSPQYQAPVRRHQSLTSSSTNS